MLLERGHDQAHGLRRMFAAAPPRVLDIAAGHAGVGRTSVAVNLGAALARCGHATLVVDVLDAGRDGKALQYLGRACSPPEARDAGAASHAQAGSIAVLEIDQGSQPQSGAHEPSSFAAAKLARAAAARDCILVTSLAAEPVVIGAHGQREIMLVLSPAASSITAAYAIVKRLALTSHRCRFTVLVNRADSRAAALRIFRSMARVADSYLDVQLELIGFIPADPCIRQASAHGRSVVDWQPKSAAAHAFRQLAQAIGEWPRQRPARHAETDERGSAAAPQPSAP